MFQSQACKSLCSSTEGSDEDRYKGRGGPAGAGSGFSCQGSGAAMSIATKLGALLEEAYIPGSRAVLDDVVSGLRHGEAVRWIATAMPWRLPLMTWTAPSPVFPTQVC